MQKTCHQKRLIGQTIKEEVITHDDLSVFMLVNNWLDRYFAGETMEIGD